MSYTISDIAELVEYHLVVSAPDDDAAHVVQLVSELERMAPGRCGAKPHGSSAIAAGARSTPTSSIPTAITTPTMATSTAPTAGKQLRNCGSGEGKRSRQIADPL